jgi:tetratricopeptide (TPR) repeat protein
MKKLILLFLLAFSTAIVAAPIDNPESMYSRALLLISEKEYQNALTMLKEIENDTQLENRKQHILYQMAVCYYNLNKIEDATTYAERSIDIDYTYDKPYLLLFDLYNNDERYDDSVFTLHSLAELRPDSFEYHYTLGIMYAEYIKNSALSIKSFERVLELSENTSISPQILENSYIYLANLYMLENRYKDAIRAGYKSVQYNPKNNMRMYTMANYFISKNMLGEAVTTVDYFLENLTDEQKENKFLTRVILLWDECTSCRIEQKQ